MARLIFFVFISVWFSVKASMQNQIGIGTNSFVNHLNAGVYWTRISGGHIGIDSAGYTARAFSTPQHTMADRQLMFEGEKEIPVFGCNFRFQFSNPSIKNTTIAPTNTKFNYFIGSDTTKWKRGIVGYEGLLQGLANGPIIEWRSGEENVENYFSFQDQNSVQDFYILISGADSISLSADRKTIILRSGIFYYEESIPSSWILDSISGAKQEVVVNYELSGDTVRFFCPLNIPYGSTLIVDPVLSFGTFFGGTADDYFIQSDIQVDPTGASYSSGYTTSLNLPVSPGAFQVANSGGIADIFFIKLNNAGTGLDFCTYIGGPGLDYTFDLSFETSSNSIVLASSSWTSTIPMPVGAFQTLHAGGIDADLMILRFNSNGNTIINGTYFGGTFDDQAHGIDIDSNGDIYIVGQTNSSNFPVTPSSFQGTIQGDYDHFVVRFNSNLTNRIAATYLGGPLRDRGNGIDVVASGVVFGGGATSPSFPVTPGCYDNSFNGIYDGVVSKMNHNLSSLIYSTFIGGSGSDNIYNSIVVDQNDCAWVTGAATNGFPTTPLSIGTNFQGGTSDVFIAQFSSNGNTLLYSAILGGSGLDEGYNIDLMPNGNMLFTGLTTPGYPTTTCTFDDSHNGQADIFVSVFSTNTMALEMSTFIGGPGNERGIGVAFQNGNIYVMGHSDANGLPISTGAFQSTNSGARDIYFARLAPDIPPNLQVQALDSVCINQAMNFSIPALPQGTTLSWVFGDGSPAVTGLTPSHSYSTPGVFYFYVVISNPCFSDTLFDSVHVNGNLPAPIISPFSSMCPGQTIQLTAQVIGTATWLPPISSNLLSVSFVPDSALTYGLFYQDNGCMSDTLFFQVPFLPSANLLITGPDSICSGSQVTLVASCDPGYSLFWPDQNSFLSSISPLINTDSTFTVIAQNGSCPDTLDFSIISIDPSSGGFSLQDSVCQLQEVSIFSVDYGFGSFTWIPEGFPILTDSIPTVAFSQLGYNTITLNITNICGNSSFVDSVFVNPSPPAPIISGPDSVCLGQQVVLNSPNSVNWLGNPGLIGSSISFNIQGDTTIQAFQTNAFQCKSDTVSYSVFVLLPPEALFVIPNNPCFSDSIFPANFSLNFDSSFWLVNGVSTALSSAGFILTPFPGLFSIQLITVNQCSQDTFNVAFNNPIIPPAPVISAPSSVCPGANIQISANATGSIFWTPFQPGNPNQFYETINVPTFVNAYSVSNNGCFSDTASFFIDTIHPPDIQIVGDSIFCSGDTANFFLIGSNGVINWNGIATGTNDTIAFPVFSSGVLNVISNLNGCYSYDSLRITHINKPIGEIFGPEKICEGDTAIFRYKGSGNHIWINPQGQINDSLFVWNNLIGGQIQVLPFSQQCTGDTVHFDFQFIEKPPPTQIVLSVDTCKSIVDFNVENVFNQEYVWIMPDGIEKVGSSVSHQISFSGHQITRLINNYMGCSYEDTIIIDYDPLAFEKMVFIPNSFTPNNDGLNEVFQIIQRFDCMLLKLEIFNRWGQLIHSHTDHRPSWDGKYLKEEVPEGVYSYILTNESGQLIKGSLTVYR
jgi:gliding motility-associated-like protein